MINLVKDEDNKQIGLIKRFEKGLKKKTKIGVYRLLIRKGYLN